MHIKGYIHYKLLLKIIIPVMLMVFMLSMSPMKAQDSSNDMISQIAWSINQDRIATGRNSGLVEILDVQSGQVLRTLQGHSGGILDLAWSPDGTQLASASADKTVRIWDTVTGESLFTLTHIDMVTSVVWSADGSKLYSDLLEPPDSFYVWNPNDGTLLSQTTVESYRIVANCDRSQLLFIGSLTSPSAIEIWNTLTLKPIKSYSHSYDTGDGPFDGAWSPDGRLFATRSLNGFINIWNASSLVVTQTLEADDTPAPGRLSQVVVGLKFSPDGSKLLSLTHDGTFKIWDTSNWQATNINVIANPVLWPAFSPDATHLAYADENNKVVIVRGMPETTTESNQELTKQNQICE